MTFEAFRYYATTQGWGCVDNTAFGLYQGWPFRADLEPGVKNVIYISFRVDRTVSMGHLRALRRALPKDCGATQAWPGAIELVCAGPDEDLDQSLRGCMDAAAATFLAAGHTLPERCPCCGGPDCDVLVLAKGGYVPAHRACVERGDMPRETPFQLFQRRGRTGRAVNLTELAPLSVRPYSGDRLQPRCGAATVCL